MLLVALYQENLCIWVQNWRLRYLQAVRAAPVESSEDLSPGAETPELPDELDQDPFIGEGHISRLR